MIEPFMMAVSGRPDPAVYTCRTPIKFKDPNRAISLMAAPGVFASIVDRIEIRSFSVLARRPICAVLSMALFQIVSSAFACSTV